MKGGGGRPMPAIAGPGLSVWHSFEIKVLEAFKR